MSVKRSLSAVAMCVLLVGTADAQGLRNADEPAEFPPSSFTGKQYIDSKGCVYVRAGIDGNTTWVPRVSRARKHICGQTPSLGSTQVAAAKSQPKPEVPVITITPEPTIPVVSAPAPAAQQPAPAPRVVAQARPAPKPAPKPRVIAKKPAPVVVQPAPQPQVVASGQCAGASAISSKYINSSQKLVIRCGPQTGGHGAYGTQQRLTYGTAVPATAPIKAPNQIGIASKRRAAKHGLAPAPSVHPHALVIPKHVYAENVAEQQHTLHVPNGYRPAWDDDRLNPRRAYGTLAGKAQMELLWTRTLPRRLIDKHSGRDVTEQFPTLYYPFTSQAQLDAARLAMAQGKKVKVRVKHAQAAHVSTKNAPQQVQVQRTVKPAAVKTPRVAKAASHRFVQVGTYGNPANANAAVRRLQAAGLPVKLGLVTRKGRKLQMVLAGPFGTQNQLQSALTVARRAGFADAIFRK